MIETPEDVPDVWQAEEKACRRTASGRVGKALHDLEPTERAIVEASCETMRILFCTKQPFPNESLLTKLAQVSWGVGRVKTKARDEKHVSPSRQALTMVKQSA